MLVRTLRPLRDPSKVRRAERYFCRRRQQSLESLASSYDESIGTRAAPSSELAKSGCEESERERIEAGIAGRGVKRMRGKEERKCAEVIQEPRPR